MFQYKIKVSLDNISNAFKFNLLCIDPLTDVFIFLFIEWFIDTRFTINRNKVRNGKYTYKTRMTLKYFCAAMCCLFFVQEKSVIL